MANSINTDSAEIWKPVPGWEGLYSVSSHGNIMSEARSITLRTRWDGEAVRHLPAKPLRPRDFRGRYKQISFRDGGRVEHWYLHRVVCIAFHGPPPSAGHVVAHNDGNGLNNYAANLRWATYAENTADMAGHGTRLIGDSHPSARIREKDVREIRRRADWRLDETFAAALGIKKKTVQNIRLGFKWKHVA